MSFVADPSGPTAIGWFLAAFCLARKSVVVGFENSRRRLAGLVAIEMLTEFLFHFAKFIVIAGWPAEFIGVANFPTRAAVLGATGDANTAGSIANRGCGGTIGIGRTVVDADTQRSGHVVVGAS